MNHRSHTYRVYFTNDPGTYHVVSARNVRIAVQRAKQSHHALRPFKGRKYPLKVAKIERLNAEGKGQ